MSRASDFAPESLRDSFSNIEAVIDTLGSYAYAIDAELRDVASRIAAVSSIRPQAPNPADVRSVPEPAAE